MKHLKKIFAAAMALFMALAVVTPAFAQTVATGKGGNATITISNASKGETYTVSKLFDASVTGKEGGSVVYTGEIPAALSAYFTADGQGYISAGEIDWAADDVQAAFKDWAEANVTADAVSDGSELQFTGLEYGYYIVTTTQGEMNVTVNTTNPNATLVDKNFTEPFIDKDLGKQVDDDLVSIGQQVEYTVTFKASNFDGAGTDAKRIVSYTITDTLPNFLGNVEVQSIYIDEDPISDTNQLIDVTTQFVDNAITLAWVDSDGNSMYANESNITITYTATVTADAQAGNGGNVNTVKLYWTDEGDPEPGEPEDPDNPNPPAPHGGTDEYTVTETIKTAAAAIQKVDENGDPLAGATFSIKGLEVTGANGNYTVVSYNSADDAADGTTMAADDTGLIVIRGIAEDETLIATEVAAPAGYNRLTTTVEVTPVYTQQATTVTTTTVYLDENGEVTEEVTETTQTVVETNADLVAAAAVVENHTGTTLPSTGGMGTTLFYIIGGILVAGAAIALVVKNRVAKIEE